MCGHSEEWPKGTRMRSATFKPLFAMTNRKSYQRTMANIIHPYTIFVNSKKALVLRPFWYLLRNSRVT